jgi:hypothetical protein
MSTTIATGERFDWDNFVETFDWQTFHTDCVKAHFQYPLDDWGIPVEKDGYRVIPLNLSLTSEDMSVLESKCGSFGTSDSWRYVYKLTNNLLFMIFENDGSCDAVIRFGKSEAGFMALEVLQDVANLNLNVDPGEFYAVKMLSDLLPGCRCGLVDEDDDDTWFWREPSDPGYIPVPHVPS